MLRAAPENERIVVTSVVGESLRAREYEILLPGRLLCSESP